MLRFIIKSKVELINYGTSHDDLKYQIFSFTMRGLGFSEEAIAEGWKIQQTMDLPVERRVG